MPSFNILESVSPEFRAWCLENGDTQSCLQKTDLTKEGERSPKPTVPLEERLDVAMSIKQLCQEQFSSLAPGCVVGSFDGDQLGAIARASRSFDWLFQSCQGLESAAP